MRSKVGDSEVAQHRARAPPLDPAEFLAPFAGDVCGGGDRVGLFGVCVDASFTKTGQEHAAQARSSNLDHFRRLLPAFETVDIAGANESGADRKSGVEGKSG